jgi:hypothetical protein
VTDDNDDDDDDDDGDDEVRDVDILTVATSLPTMATSPAVRFV